MRQKHQPLQGESRMNTNMNVNTNNKLQFTILTPNHCDSVNENRILPAYRHEATFTELYNFMQDTRMICHRKEDGKFIIPSSFVAGDCVARLAENVLDWYMLPIDIDGGMTIDAAKQKWKDYNYILYTSFNHSDSLHKFRLLIELEHPMPDKTFERKRKAIYEWLGDGIDRTCLYRSRGFYLPTSNINNPTPPILEINYAKPLDWTIFSDEVEVTQNYAPIECSTDDRQRILAKLRETTIDSYETWWQMISAMKNSGYSLQDAISVSAGNRLHDSSSFKNKTVQDVTQYYNRQHSKPNERSIGFLIKLIRKQFPDFKMTSNSTSQHKPQLKLVTTSTSAATTATTTTTSVFWTQHTNQDGRPLSNIRAFEDYLKHHDIQLAYNELDGCVEFSGNCNLPHWNNSLHTDLKVDLIQAEAKVAGLSLTVNNVASFVNQIAHRNSYHPIVAWINSKPWDGQKRFAQIARTIATRMDRSLYETLLFKWMLSASKILTSSPAVEGVLIFCGDQGIGKSTWFENLVPANYKHAYTKGGSINPTDTTSIMKFHKSWIYENGEIAHTFSRAGNDELKNFITAAEDTIRPPYGRTPITVKRRQVMVGTSDVDHIIQEEQARRLWVIPVVRFNLHLFKEIDMQQVWAEMATYHNCEHWLSAEERQALQEHQQSFRNNSPIVEYFKQNYSATQQPNYKVRQISASQILEKSGVSRGSPTFKQQLTELRNFLTHSKIKPLGKTTTYRLYERQ